MLKVPARTSEYLLLLVSSGLYNVTCRLLSKLPTLVEFYYVLKEMFYCIFFCDDPILFVYEIYGLIFCRMTI